jgi:UDP-galactopyranose mutase
MTKTKYDYLIVGAGLTGSVFAHEAKKRPALGLHEFLIVLNQPII